MAGLAALQAQAAAWLARIGLAPRRAQAVLLALDELAANLVEHAATAVPFEVRLTEQPAQIELLLVDHGAPFDPRHAPSAPVARSLDEAPIGGLGLILVRQLATSIDYRRVAHGNQLRLCFAREDALTAPSDAPPAG